MAKSKYEYVKQFERDEVLLPDCYMVVRLDGKSFSKFVSVHEYAKPNDVRGVLLMEECAKAIFKAFPECAFAIGASDEFSFVLPRNTTLYGRRRSKIESTFVSLFASSFVFLWPTFFDIPLQYAPAFDCRIVLYPSFSVLRDYISWRQVDFHINNLYNTTFWALVQRGGRTPSEAHADLRGTTSDVKNEILFSRFDINYNREEAMFRKGSILFKGEVQQEVTDSRSGGTVVRKKKRVMVEHDDVISDSWWLAHVDVIPH